MNKGNFVIQNKRIDQIESTKKWRGLGSLVAEERQRTGLALITPAARVDLFYCDGKNVGSLLN